jgi:hypothetical protein
MKKVAICFIIVSYSFGYNNTSINASNFIKFFCDAVGLQESDITNQGVVIEKFFYKIQEIQILTRLLKDNDLSNESLDDNLYTEILNNLIFLILLYLLVKY